MLQASNALLLLVIAKLQTVAEHLYMHDVDFSEELRDMMIKAGLTEEQNHMDRRLQVNRGRQLKMYRVWIQCKYRK
jgi:hypothetical protein